MATARALLCFLAIAACARTVSASSQAVTQDRPSTSWKPPQTSQPGPAKLNDGDNGMVELTVRTENEALQALQEAEDNQLIYLDLFELHLPETIVLRVSNFAIEGRKRWTRIQCPPQGSAFDIEGTNVNLTNLYIAHCKYGSAVGVGSSSYESKPRKTGHSTSRRNKKNSSTHTVNIQQCTFLKNEYSFAGAAIAVSDTELVATDCEFQDNVAELGAAISAFDSDVTIKHSTFVRIDGAEAASGVIWAEISEVTIKNSQFINTRSASGGAISTYWSDVTIEDSEFWNSSAAKEGGAVQTELGYLIVQNCAFINAFAENGGVIHSLDSAFVVIEESLFENTEAENMGGSIYISGNSHLFLYTSSILYSSAASGGAVAATDDATVEIARSRLNEVSSSSSGGALYINHSSSCTVTDSQIENSYAGLGGAVSLGNNSRLTVQTSVFYNNSAVLGESVYASCAKSKYCNVTIDRSDFAGFSEEQAGGALFLVNVYLDGEQSAFRLEEA